MKWKKSMFNFYHECNDGTLRLYNSMNGVKSLAIINKSEKEAFFDIMNNENDLNKNEKLFQQLIEYGYIVPNDRDERKHRTVNNIHQIADSTLHLIILPTEQCNFRCKYCYEAFKKGKMETPICDSIITFVRKNIANYIALRVEWFGGEPLCAIDVIERLSIAFIEICKCAKKRYSAGITTNGYALTLENYLKLYKYKILNYQITLDGLQKDHDSQRVLSNGAGTFDIIISNIKNIKEKTKHKNVSFTIRTNFTREIFNHIDDYIEYYTKLLGNDSRFNLYIHMVSDWGGDRITEIHSNLMQHNEYGLLINAISKKNEEY